MMIVNERKEKSFRSTAVSSGGCTVKVEEAVKAAAEWNKRLNAERKEKRSAAFDLQTMTVHYPRTGKGKMKVGDSRVQVNIFI